MNEIALLIAATLNAGTVLAIAALGLLLNERAGVVNLGAEGMMLVAAVVGYAAAVHSGSDLLAFAAGALAGALLASVFGLLVIWLNTNQYATGLALSLFGVDFSAFIGQPYTRERLSERAQFEIPLLSDIPLPWTIKPGADPNIVIAEQTCASALDIMDEFLRWERAHQAALPASVHKSAEEIRRHGVGWIKELRAATKQYKQDPQRRTRWRSYPLRQL